MPPFSLVTPEERKSAMRHAVSYNAPCDLWVLAGSAPVRTKSRFLGLQRGARGADVILEAPVAEGSILPVRAGDGIEVFFNADGDRFTYMARILDRTTFELNGGTTVRAIRTAYPSRMVRGQKRNFYRINMPLGRPIEMRYGLVDRYTPGSAAYPRIVQRGRIELRDLSGGGLSFEVRKNSGTTLRPGDRMECAFRLPTNGDVRLLARVANTRADHGRSIIRFGAEFVDIHTRVEFKQDRDQILRYVADHQQRELARRSGIHA